MPGLPVVGKAHEAKAGAPFTWFIYGSSLDRDAFARWAAEHGYQVPDFARARPVRLAEHRLVFDTQSKFWGGGVPSPRPAPGHAVEGIALPLSGEARGLVDHKEGAISGLYAPFAVSVTPLDGGPAIAALAFRAARPLANPTTPSPGFLQTLLKGARDWQLSPSWIAELEALAG